MLSALLAFALLAGPAPSGAASPSPAPTAGPVILFLIDNSASLPPLDPSEKRVAALEKMFTFLQGQRYRLILFAGRKEIAVDDVSQYRNSGQWTDFFAAFEKAKELAAGYPKGTELRMVLLTDAIPDPDPADWTGLPPGTDLRALSIHKTVDLLGTMRIPLYVVLVGQLAGPESVKNPEQSPGFVLDMVRAANGNAASPLAQSIASFFKDDGVLLKKFVYRVAPHEGLKKIEPVVRRIAAPAQPKTELRILSYVVLPLCIMLFLLLGALVRSFPGPGDLEILELNRNQPVHVVVDKLRRASDGSWSAQGLSLAPDARGAVASFTLQVAPVDLTGHGIDASGLDPRDAELLPLGLDEMRRRLEAATDSGSRDEKIHALNLDYAARSLQPQEAERLLTRPAAERARLPAIDFIRAKAHLAFDDALRRKLLEPKVQLLSYGKDASRREIGVGDTLRIGRYRFLVKDLLRGGRKELRVVLYYDRVPSLFGLKTILPDLFQRAFRFRRSSQRTVS
jgi:hypothetical protein